MAYDPDKAFNDMTEDERLEYGQRTRHDIISMFTHDSTGAKTNIMSNEQANVVKGLLKDMDANIYTKRRLAVDEVSAENDKRVALLAEDVMSSLKVVGRNKDNYVPQTNGITMDSSALRRFEHTEGEVEPVGNEVNLDEIERYGRRLFKGVVEDDSDN